MRLGSMVPACDFQHDLRRVLRFRGVALPHDRDSRRAIIAGARQPRFSRGSGVSLEAAVTDLASYGDEETATASRELAAIT